MNPVQVRSLVRAKNGVFIPLAEVQSDAASRWMFVEGAIELTVRQKAVITTEEWDDIDDLWINITSVVRKICGGEEQAEMYFPDQPIMFRLSRIQGGMMEVVSEKGNARRRAVAAERDIVTALCRAGISFFGHLISLGAAGNEYATQRQILVDCLDGISRK